MELEEEVYQSGRIPRDVVDGCVHPAYTALDLAVAQHAMDHEGLSILK